MAEQILISENKNMAEQVHAGDSQSTSISSTAASIEPEKTSSGKINEIADQVHPEDSKQLASSGSTPAPVEPEKTTSEKKHIVVQLPKDIILSTPPPENALRQKNFLRRKAHKARQRVCICWTICLLVILLAATTGILYLIFRPERVKYTVDSISIKGFNLSSKSTISPSIDISVLAKNPHKKLGIYYEKGGSVAIRYNDVKLCDGFFPVFYQPSNNWTIFQTQLRGTNMVIPRTVYMGLARQQKENKVPFILNMKAPVRMKIGAIKTWTITFKVKCDLTVDTLTASPNIVSQHCNYRVKWV